MNTVLIASTALVANTSAVKLEGFFSSMQWVSLDDVMNEFQDTTAADDLFGWAGGAVSTDVQMDNDDGMQMWSQPETAVEVASTAEALAEANNELAEGAEYYLPDWISGYTCPQWVEHESEYEEQDTEPTENWWWPTYWM